MIGVTYSFIREGEAGLFYVNGRFVRTLGAGRHRLVNWPWSRQEVVRVDLRRAQLQLAGQEMLTADALSVRLNASADYRVVAPVQALHSVQDFKVTLYLALQIALREEVQGRTLEQLLADRSALSGALLERGRAAAAELGLELISVGVKDVVLPGDIKRMLSQEAEALRTGRAALVAAREETAATRAKANTAQLLQSQPVLLRLREIEALAQVANGLGNTVIIAAPPEMVAAVGGVNVRRSE